MAPRDSIAPRLIAAVRLNNSQSDSTERGPAPLRPAARYATVEAGAPDQQFDTRTALAVKVRNRMNRSRHSILIKLHPLVMEFVRLRCGARLAFREREGYRTIPLQRDHRPSLEYVAGKMSGPKQSFMVSSRW